MGAITDIGSVDLLSHCPSSEVQFLYLVFFFAGAGDLGNPCYGVQLHIPSKFCNFKNGTSFLILCVV